MTRSIHGLRNGAIYILMRGRSRVLTRTGVVIGGGHYGAPLRLPRPAPLPEPASEPLTGLRNAIWPALACWLVVAMSVAAAVSV